MADIEPIAFTQFTGVRNDAPAERLGPADLAAADNVDLDDTGALRLRQGFSRSIAGADVHSLWSSGTEAYYVDGTTLRRINPDGTSSSTLAAGLTPHLPMSYWEHAGRVYHSNGMENGVIEAGVVRTWGLTPPRAPTLGAGAGSVPAGTYQVVYTYVAADGQESGCGAAATITLAAPGGISVALEASRNPRVAQCRLYCTTTDGETLYWAADVPNGTAALTITTGHDQLQSPLATQFCDEPPAGQAVAYFNGRMFVARDNLLYYSQPFALELFKATNHVAFASRITMVAPTLDGLFVSDSQATFWLAGNDPDQFDVRQRHDSAAVEGSLAYAPAGRVTALEGEFEVPVWLTGNGVAVGQPQGLVSVLGKGYRFDVPARGAGLFRKQRQTYQYLASFLGD